MRVLGTRDHGVSLVAGTGKEQQNVECARERRAIPAVFFPLLARTDRTDPVNAARILKSTDPSVIGRSDLLVYVHIPFCQNLCRFCGYYRHAVRNDADRLVRYVDRLLAELRWWSDSGLLDQATVSSVYVGGGTPSVLPAAQIDRLLGGLRSYLPLPRDTVELSFEGEARSLGDPERLAVLNAHGVTRVSYGVQSLDPDVRRLAGLEANLDDLLACADAVRAHGFSVGVDLIYGLPAQTPQTFERDLAGVVEDLGASMIDLYELIVYPNAALFGDIMHAGITVASDAERETMYLAAVDYFQGIGYRQWSLEDFCRPGNEYQMKHLVYGGDDGRAQTLALGACAVGYMGGHTYRNEVLDPYLAAPEDFPPIATLRTASSDEQRRRPLFFYPRRLFLQPNRVPGGLDEQTSAILERQIDAGWAARDDDDTVRLTRAGMLRADDIVRDFLTGTERRKLFKIVQ